MNHEKTLDILRLLSKKGYSIADLCCAIEYAAESGQLPEVMEKNDLAEARIVKSLKELGAPSHLIGWDYLVSMILRCVKNPMEMYNAMKLYQKIAEKFNTKVSSVERNVRVVVDKVKENELNKNVLLDYFGTCQGITIKQFYVGVSRKVIKEMGG